MAKKDKKKSDLIKSYKTKRCWSCNTHMTLNQDKCPSCGRRVGEVNEHGVARKPVEWMNYLLSFGAICLLVLFVWYMFLRSG